MKDEHHKKRETDQVKDKITKVHNLDEDQNLTQTWKNVRIARQIVNNIKKK
jgi:hypothetical protein